MGTGFALFIVLITTEEADMAAIWKGALTFGLVNIPVELRAAVRNDAIHFRLLHGKDSSPVRYERVCEKDGKTIPWDEIVKGYEYEKGKFVVMTDKDFEAAALENSRTIDILDFVQEGEIDPRYFETPYYMLPTKGGERPYALLREAIRKSGSIGIGKIILRQTQHLAGIKVVGDALVIEMMRFANELVDVTEYKFPKADHARPQEVRMAQQLIDNLAGTFEPEKYTDEYRANLMRVIKSKMKGKQPKLKAPEKGEADDKVIDLMARLQASLEGSRSKPRSTAKSGRKGASALRAKLAKSRRRKSA